MRQTSWGGVAKLPWAGAERPWAREGSAGQGKELQQLAKGGHSSHFIHALHRRHMHDVT